MVLDDHVVVPLPDFAGCIVVVALYSSADMSFVGLCKAFMLDPLVDGVESTCESRV